MRVDRWICELFLDIWTCRPEKVKRRALMKDDRVWLILSLEASSNESAEEVEEHEHIRTCWGVRNASSEQTNIGLFVVVGSIVRDFAAEPISESSRSASGAGASHSSPIECASAALRATNPGAVAAVGGADRSVSGFS